MNDLQHTSSKILSLSLYHHPHLPLPVLRTLNGPLGPKPWVRCLDGDSGKILVQWLDHTPTTSKRPGFPSRQPASALAPFLLTFLKRSQLVRVLEAWHPCPKRVSCQVQK